MRIIAGSAKGRHLKAAPDNRIRPTSDRVKESIFNILGDFVQDTQILDLFAGTGNLSFEAISRGANHAFFVDKAYLAIKIIKQNAENLNFVDCCTILHCDAKKAIHLLASQNLQFDLIFVDPPYADEHTKNILLEICDYNLLNENGVIVLEKAAKNEMPQFSNLLTIVKTANYGDTSIVFFRLQSVSTNSENREQS